MYFVLQYFKLFWQYEIKNLLGKTVMRDYCNCCYKKVWVYSTIEVIYISVFP